MEFCCEIKRKINIKYIDGLTLCGIIHIVEMTNDEGCFDDNNEAINWESEANDKRYLMKISTFKRMSCKKKIETVWGKCSFCRTKAMFPIYRQD